MGCSQMLQLHWSRWTELHAPLLSSCFTEFGSVAQLRSVLSDLLRNGTLFGLSSSYLLLVWWHTVCTVQLT